MTDERFRGLLRLNGAVGVLHLLQGLAMIALANDLEFPITAGFLTQDPVTVRGAAEGEIISWVPFGLAVASFMLLAAADHLLMLVPPISRWYRRNLDQGRNFARWIEYSVSASLMIVLISMLTGIFDLAALMALFALNASMILFGLLMEKHQSADDDPDMTAFWFGSLAGAVPWVIITIYLVNGTPPGFVIGIFVSLFVFFNSFAVNMWLQYRRIGPWRDYIFGERAYMFLSLGAKSLLAWQLYANVLRS